MVKKKSNPLNKRFLRELKSEAGKYIVLFVFIEFLFVFRSVYDSLVELVVSRRSSSLNRTSRMMG